MNKFSIRKWNGDDQYSWAVFKKGRSEPIVTGLSRREAQFYRKQFEDAAVKKDAKRIKKD
jgi:hypothetical protein